MESNLEREIYRMTFLGSCNSGKTTIINNLVNNNFINCYEPTYSIEIYETEFEIDNKENSLFSSKTKKDIVELIIEDT